MEEDFGVDLDRVHAFLADREQQRRVRVDERETALSAAFDAFRTAVRKLVSAGTGPRRRAGTFAVEILGKRLPSCPTAFAESWSRARQGFSDPDVEAAAETELAAAARAVRQETGDDREAEQREATAATVVGAWLRNFVETERLADIERSIEEKQEELTRRRHHYEEIRDQLQRERTRILDHLLPARFAVAGNAQAFPVAVEVRLPDR